MSEKLRIGILGAGGISQLVHIPLVKKHPGADLIAIADIERDKASFVADRFKIPFTYRDPERLLARDDIDAVHINTPTNTHLALTLAALSAGKHVLVEKPIARNYAEAHRMVEAARVSGKKLMVAMNHRFRQDSTVLRNFVEAGELGKVRIVRTGWLKKKDRWSRSDWLSNSRISGGGVLMDLGIQMLDVCLWVMGSPPVKRVVAQLGRDRLGLKVEDTLVAFYSLQNDSCIILNVSWAFMSDESDSYTIFSGSHGSAHLNPFKITKEVQGSLVNITPEGKQLKSQDLYRKSYEAEIDHFYKNIHSRSRLISSGEEAAFLMKTIEATYRSAAENREVFVEEE
jgi:predicted dehydrogenase